VKLLFSSGALTDPITTIMSLLRSFKSVCPVACYNNIIPSGFFIIITPPFMAGVQGLSHPGFSPENNSIRKPKTKDHPCLRQAGTKTQRRRMSINRSCQVFRPDEFKLSPTNGKLIYSINFIFNSLQNLSVPMLVLKTNSLSESVIILLSLEHNCLASFSLNNNNMEQI
jgi:hypothetical protein